MTDVRSEIQREYHNLGKRVAKSISHPKYWWVRDWLGILLPSESGKPIERTKNIHCIHGRSRVTLQEYHPCSYCLSSIKWKMWICHIYGIRQLQIQILASIWLTFRLQRITFETFKPSKSHVRFVSSPDSTQGEVWWSLGVTQKCSDLSNVSL